MQHSKLQVSYSDLEAGIGLIGIAGEVNAFAEKELVEAYNQAVGADAQTIILDFQEMSFMNSGGIGLLVTLLIRANRQGRRLVAVGLNEHFKHIFELTRLNDAFHLHDTVEEARAAAVSLG